MLAFSESGNWLDFFDIGWVGRQVSRYGTLTLNWFVLGVAANLGFQVIGSLPVIGILGTVLSLAMSAPIQGHLLGQYAAILDERNGKTDRPNGDESVVRPEAG